MSSSWIDTIILQDQVGLFARKVANRAGDGSLSTFENPRRAIECALALQTAWPDLGVETRIGIHFGEVERREDGAVGWRQRTRRRPGDGRR